MAELTFNMARQVFKSQSITEKDYLSYDELYHIINKLNITEFDEQTFEQIWDQCKLNSKGEVRISDFIEVVLKGQALLIQKQQENANEILRLDNEKKGKITDFADQHRYKEQMDNLLEQKQGVINSLSIIRRPFIIALDATIKPNNPANHLQSNPELKQQIPEDDIVRQLFQYDSSETAATLLTIFYITATLIVLAWLTSFFICQFLSLIVYTVILSQFSFQIISRKIIKLNLILLLACTLLDVLWIIIQTGNIWYLPTNYELAKMTSSYLKFSIVIIIFCTCLRMTLIYYYLSQFYIDEFQVYSIKIFGKDLNIQRETEPYSSNKNPLSYLLEPYFNKAVAQGEQIQ